MSAPVIDAAIFILLVISIGFGVDWGDRSHALSRYTQQDVYRIQGNSDQLQRDYSIRNYLCTLYLQFKRGGSVYCSDSPLHGSPVHHRSGKWCGIQDYSRPDKIGNILPTSHGTKRRQELNSFFFKFPENQIITAISASVLLTINIRREIFYSLKNWFF